MIDFSALLTPDLGNIILQLANNASNIFSTTPGAPPLVTPTPTDNIIATTGQVEQVQDQTTNTIIGSITAVGAAISGVFIKNNHDNKKNKQEIKDTDISLSEYINLEALEDKYTLQNPTKTRAEILQMPAYPDEPAIKTSLAEARAKERREWEEDIRKKYYANPT